MGFGSKAGGGFNEASRSFKQNPTLKHYLALRRRDPGVEVEVAVFGGIDDLFTLEE